MDKEQREALYGPGTRFSEHKEGEEIRFTEGGQEKTGTILHVRAAGPAIVGGKDHPVIYVVDTGQGFPSMVAPSQVLEGSAQPQPFFVLLATYGSAYSTCKSQEEAENLAANVVDEVITGEVKGEAKRLRVIKAWVEGDVPQGRVVGECEVVEETK